MDTNSGLRIYDFMTMELNLKLTELFIYAVIYQYSGFGKGDYQTDNMETFCFWSGRSEKTVRRAIKSLVAKELITAEILEGKITSYRALKAPSN